MWVNRSHKSFESLNITQKPTSKKNNRSSRPKEIIEHSRQSNDELNLMRL